MHLFSDMMVVVGTMMAGFADGWLRFRQGRLTSDAQPLSSSPFGC
jgi:hypothetical protein